RDYARGGGEGDDSGRSGAGGARRAGGGSQGVRDAFAGAGAGGDDGGHDLRHCLDDEVRGDGDSGDEAGAGGKDQAERSGGGVSAGVCQERQGEYYDSRAADALLRTTRGFGFEGAVVGTRRGVSDGDGRRTRVSAGLAIYVQRSQL